MTIQGVAPSILDCIGSTPLVQLNRLVRPGDARVLVKLEGFNAGGCVKSRTALSIVETAEREGKLKPDSVIVEYTSGNQGIALSLVAAVKGYRCIIIMPEAMSVERRKTIQAYGAELIITPIGRNIEETIRICEAKSKELADRDPRVFLANQFGNPANPDVHRRTTAAEILSQVRGPIDAFVAGWGTGGTITGVGDVLKAVSPSTRIIAVEPTEAALLAGGPIGHHIQQGIGDGILAPVLNPSIIDEVLMVTDAEAVEASQRLAREEGILVGVSSGTAVCGALRVAERLGPGRTVVTLLADGGERYYSTPLFENLDRTRELVGAR